MPTTARVKFFAAMKCREIRRRATAIVVINAVFVESLVHGSVAAHGVQDSRDVKSGVVENPTAVANPGFVSFASCRAGAARQCAGSTRSWNRAWFERNTNGHTGGNRTYAVVSRKE